MKTKNNKLALMLGIMGFSLLVSGVASAASTSNTDPTCNPNVRQSIVDQQVAAINGQRALAVNNFPDLDSSFGKLSCLENIMNSGIDIFFSVPSFSDLLNQITNMVCSATNDLKRDATRPFYDKLSEINSATSSSLNVGEIIPGYSLNGLGRGPTIRTTNGDMFRNLKQQFQYDDAGSITWTNPRNPATQIDRLIGR